MNNIFFQLDCWTIYVKETYITSKDLTSAIVSGIVPVKLLLSNILPKDLQPKEIIM